MSELQIGAGMTISGAVDSDGEIEVNIDVTTGCRYSQHIDRDDALEIITHLFNVFGFEIHATIIQSNES